MELKDIITLKEAGELLDLAPVSLRAAIARGRFDAAKVGTTWITTRQELERYRSENLGQVGRPATTAAGAAVPERVRVPRNAAAAGAAIPED